MPGIADKFTQSAQDSLLWPRHDGTGYLLSRPPTRAALQSLHWRHGRAATILVQIVSVLSIREGRRAHRRDRRRPRGPLFRLSVEKASPGRPYRAVRTER